MTTSSSRSLLGSIRHRGGDRYQLRAPMKPDPITGKRRELVRTVRVKSARAAQEKLNELLVEAGSAPLATSELTVAQAFERWYDHQVDSEAWSAGWTKRVRSLLDVHVIPQIGSIRLDRLETYDIDRFYAAMRSGAYGKEQSAQSVLRAHTVVRSALATCVRWRWLPSNPAEAVESLSRARRTINPPTSDEVRQLMAAAGDDFEMRTFVHLAAATGMRLGELLALRRSDFDLEGDTPRVKVTRVIAVAEEGYEERDYPKSSAGNRQLVIDGALVATLESHFDAQQARAAKFKQKCGPKSYIFAGSTDVTVWWDLARGSKRFAKLRSDAKLEKVHIHDLRHYHATQLLARGIDVRTVAARLGHADPAITLRTYAHWVPARDVDAAAAIAAELASVGVA
jgi:integrase